MDTARATVLTTARLRLRPIAATDLDEFHGLCVDPAIRRFLFDDQAIPAEQARALIEASQASFAAHGYGLWLVHDTAPAGAAGFAGLLESDQPAPNLVVAIRPELCGRGLASEAAGAVLSHGLLTLGLARITADVDEPNLASLRVLEKLGLRRTGRGLVDGRPLVYFATTGGPGET